MPMKIPSATLARSTPTPSTHLPGEAGIWVFILGDMMLFGTLFVTFMFYRGEELTLFREARVLLNQQYGAANTLLLLASSWLVVLGVERARTARSVQARRLFSGAFLCGLGFIVIKFLEYGEKLQAGYSITSNLFFTFYYVLTGVHFMHLLMGLGVLASMIFAARNQHQESHQLAWIEGGACFWHLVDLLWIVLFPLLYLIR